MKNGIFLDDAHKYDLSLNHL